MFREEQWLRQHRVLLLIVVVTEVLLLGSALAIRRPPPLALTLLLLLPLVLLLVARMVVTVTPGAVVIRYFPFYRKSVPLAEVVAAEVVTYRPLLDYGGWGIRWNPKLGWAYTVAGTSAVRLTLRTGKSLLIGSRESPRLRDAILGTNAST